MDIELVPNRECGECYVCCRELMIDDPALTKVQGVTCKNYSVGCGCTIYAERPQSCAGFVCGWRSIATMGEEWRPDRCGITVMWEKERPDVGWPEGLTFFIHGGLDKIFWPPFLKMANTLVDRGTPVFVMLPAPVGWRPRIGYLNIMPGVKKAAASRNMGVMANFLSQLVQQCIEGPKEPNDFVNPRND